MAASSAKIRSFQRAVWSYYRRHGREFPWRSDVGAYAILVSEVMLQQTQTSRVVEKYQQFIARFPTWQALARAPLRDVYRVWSGLGYNRRALWLRNAARMVVDEFGGRLPRDVDSIESLPGVGPYTARAVAAFAYNIPTTFIETNVRSAVIAFFFPSGRRISDQEIARIVERSVSVRNPRKWYWALMDYGVWVKAKIPNVNRRSAHYRPQGSFRGSMREARGAILRVLSGGQQLSLHAIAGRVDIPKERLQQAAKGLARDGLVRTRRGKVSLCQ